MILVLRKGNFYRIIYNWGLEFFPDRYHYTDYSGLSEKYKFIWSDLNRQIQVGNRYKKVGYYNLEQED